MACRVTKTLVAAAAALTCIRRGVVSGVRFYTGGSDDGQRVQFSTNQSRSDSIFSKIMRKEIPADIVHEDDKVSYVFPAGKQQLDKQTDEFEH